MIETRSSVEAIVVQKIEWLAIIRETPIGSKPDIAKHGAVHFSVVFDVGDNEGRPELSVDAEQYAALKLGDRLTLRKHVVNRTYRETNYTLPERELKPRDWNAEDFMAGIGDGDKS